MSKKQEMIYGVCMGIYRRDGRVTPDALVEESRPEDAPLHKMFEWNDTRAASLYRREQARTIIRRVTIQVDENTQAPAFLHVPSEPREQSYLPTEVAVSDSVQWEIAMADVKRQLSGALKRVRSLEHLAKSRAEKAKLRRVARNITQAMEIPTA